MKRLEEQNHFSDIKSLVQSDRLHLLFKQSYSSIYISMIVAIILVIILWPVQSHTSLIIWISIMSLSTIIRLYFFMEYHKQSPKGLEILSWETPYFITLTFTTLTWGIGSLFIMPLDSPFHQAIIMVFMTGLCGGIVAHYSAHTNITIITISILILPISLYFLIYGDYTFLSLSVAAFGFLISLIRATKVFGKTLKQNFTLKHQLELSKIKAEKDARIDHLTKLYNLRAFNESAISLANICERNHDPLTLILLDIDHFKKVNDTYGHTAGDYVLKEVAKTLKESVRKSDICARIGGEEFVILLPSTELEGAYNVAEEIRRTIEKKSIKFKGNLISITSSFGLSAKSYDINELLMEADEFLYQSKKLGRNRISCRLNDSSDKMSTWFFNI